MFSLSDISEDDEDEGDDILDLDADEAPAMDKPKRKLGSRKDKTKDRSGG
jgi:hypothetical protein